MTARRGDHHELNDDSYDGPDRRTPSNPIDWLSGLPSWARVLFVVGIPGAIAGFLVWKGAEGIPSIARQVDVNHSEIVAIRQAMVEHQAQTEATYRMLQRICSNTAKSEFERQRCFDR